MNIEEKCKLDMMTTKNVVVRLALLPSPTKKIKIPHYLLVFVVVVVVIAIIIVGYLLIHARCSATCSTHNIEKLYVQCAHIGWFEPVCIYATNIS